MPWEPEDASRHNSKADTPAKAKTWAAVANDILKHTKDEGAAIRGANSVLKHQHETAPPKQPKHHPATSSLSKSDNHKSVLGIGMKRHSR